MKILTIQWKFNRRWNIYRWFLLATSPTSNVARNRLHPPHRHRTIDSPDIYLTGNCFQFRKYCNENCARYHPTTYHLVILGKHMKIIKLWNEFSICPMRPETWNIFQTTPSPPPSLRMTSRYIKGNVMDLLNIQIWRGGDGCALFGAPPTLPRRQNQCPSVFHGVESVEATPSLHLNRTK